MASGLRLYVCHKLLILKSEGNLLGGRSNEKRMSALQATPGSYKFGIWNITFIILVPFQRFQF